MNDSEAEALVDRRRIEDVVTRLFVFTDRLDWENVLDKCFDADVLFDMSSLSGEGARRMPAKEITGGWEKGLRPLKAVHHQMGNLLVTISGVHATATCYATATHYLPTAKGESTKTFYGSYELGLARTVRGWRIDSLRYISKFVIGNLELGR
ncbi:MAG: nuclear transport factor 2 family protein [Methanomassiliicoccales archaeon]|nr:nuclear transport factor 2 family protein [Methanomassiliicoccales archaeon]